MTAALAPPTEPAASAPPRLRGHALPRLRELRRAAALSQAELARRAGLSRLTITRLELGQQLAYPSTVRALASALGVRPHQLRGAPPGAGGAADVKEGRH